LFHKTFHEDHALIDAEKRLICGRQVVVDDADARGLVVKINKYLVLLHAITATSQRLPYCITEQQSVLLKLAANLRH